jgi:phospholipase C
MSVGLALLALGLVACSPKSSKAGASTTAPNGASSTSGPTSTVAVSGTGIGKIKHVVVIMQENRSFDSYFGTFPGGQRPVHCLPTQPGHQELRPTIPRLG